MAAVIVLDHQGAFVLTEAELHLDSPQGDEGFITMVRAQVLASLDGQKGRKLWQIPLPPLHEELLKIPWLEQVKVTKGWPNRLLVEVKVKRLVSVFMGAQGQLRPLDKEGNLLPELSLASAPDLPILRGKDLERSISQRQKAAQAAAALPVRGSLHLGVVDEIAWSEKSGVTFWVARANRETLRVKLGQQDYSQRVLRVNRVLEQLEDKSVQWIDADFPSKVIVRLSSPLDSPYSNSGMTK